METREYELVLLVPKDSDKKIVDDIKKLVGEKGELGEVDEWGVKPLAYPIRKQREANFLHIGLSLPSGGPPILDRALRINQEVLRHLLIRHESKFKSKKEREIKAEKVKTQKESTKKRDKESKSKTKSKLTGGEN